MGSKQTTLIIANLRHSDIKKITVSDIDNSHWDGQSRPDHNFKDVAITKYSSMRNREELNDPFMASLKDGRFKMKASYEDGSEIEFSCNQKDAFSKNRRILVTKNNIEVCQTSGKGTNSIEIRDANEPNNANWMAKLLNEKPNVKLNELTMPASHDAGMYASYVNFKMTPPVTFLTHDRSIKNQLKAGSRYFDIRVMNYDNEFHTYHASKAFVGWVGGVGPKISDIISDINSFHQHDGVDEAIIIRISHTFDEDEWKVDRKALVEYLLANLRNVYVSPTDCDLSNTKLSELKAKVVLIFDQNEYNEFIDAKKGIFAYRGHNDSGNGLKVYDDYSNTKSLDVLISGGNNNEDHYDKGQIRKLEDDGGLGKNYLFNLSWTLTSPSSALSIASDIDSLDVAILSAMSRPALPEYLCKMKRNELKKPNIVNLDFIDGWICSAIINLNY